MMKVKKLITLGLFLMAGSLASATIIVRPNSYTAGTVIDPNQVNSDFNTIYNDYNGSINSTNISVNGIIYSNLSTAIQGIWNYRRPNLVYNSATIVNVETGLDGTSGDSVVVFPDGTKRTEATTSLNQMNITRTAVITGSKQSGVWQSTGQANTFYEVYAVAAQDNTTDWVAVASTAVPTQANFSYLNTNFGVNSWIPIGGIAYGNNNGATTSIVPFKQAGNITVISKQAGILLASSGGSTNQTWTYASGTSIPTSVPGNFTHAEFSGNVANGALTVTLSDSGSNINYFQYGSVSGTTYITTPWVPITDGFRIGTGASVAINIYIYGWIDGAIKGNSQL